MAIDVRKDPVVWAAQISVLEKLVKGVEFLKEHLKVADREKYTKGIFAKVPSFDEFPNVKFSMRYDMAQIPICVYNDQPKYVASVNGCISYNDVNILNKPCCYTTKSGRFDYKNFVQAADRSIGILKDSIRDYTLAISKLDEFIEEMNQIDKRLLYIMEHYGSVLGHYAKLPRIYIPYIIGLDGKTGISKV